MSPPALSKLSELNTNPSSYTTSSSAGPDNPATDSALCFTWPLFSFARKLDTAMSNAALGRQFSPGTVVATLAVSLGLWTIIGAFAYTTPRTPMQDLDFVEVFALCSILPVNFLALVFAHSEFNIHPSPPVSSAAVFSAVALGASATTAYCITTFGQRNVFHHVFLAMGSVYIGCVFELATGFFTACERRLGGDALGDAQAVGRDGTRPEMPEVSYARPVAIPKWHPDSDQLVAIGG